MNFKNIGTDDEDRHPQIGTGLLPAFPAAAGLARQSSIYSLTFDELETTLGGIGKDFGSMNMDELLKNIWNAEETQMMTLAAASTLPEGSGSGIQRQGSLTLPRTLSLKTVDEVWRELLHGSTGTGEQGSTVVNMQPQQRQPTLGEVTLEEFFMKAGIMKEEPFVNSNSMFYADFSGIKSNSNASLSLGFPSTAGSNGGAVASQPLQSNPIAQLTNNTSQSSYTPSMQLGSNNKVANQLELQGGGIVGIRDPTMNNGVLSGGVGFGAGGAAISVSRSPKNPFSEGTGRSNGNLSSVSPVPYVFDRGPNKKGGVGEKAVERRQKRMIKNRESAARSRARKQAYTTELETEVAKLKEQNEELRKKQEILEAQKNQALEMINQQPDSKKRCLRRTQTGPW